MYRSQINTILEMMEDVEHPNDFADLRRLVNRYITQVGVRFAKPKKSPKKTTYPWDVDTYFSSQMRESANKLYEYLRDTYGDTPFRIAGDVGYKIQLIKQLREFSTVFGPAAGLTESKEMIEKYFGKWC